MFINLLLCVVGIAALVYSADKLIEAASNFALNLKFSKIAIGLSIIAVGTSLPELFVSINSSLKGYSALSLGNIVGSNIMNIALILGISAIILPINSTKEIVKRENHHEEAIQTDDTTYSFYDALTDVCDSKPIRNRVYSLLVRAGVIQEMYDLNDSLDLYSDESLLSIKSFGPKLLAIARKANELYVQKKKSQLRQFQKAYTL